MPDKRTFDDGSSIEWADKETLKYIEGDFSVLVWVDFEPGFFSRGRIIKSSSIKEWNTAPEDRIKRIDEDKRQEIIRKVQDYYRSFKRKCSVED